MSTPLQVTVARLRVPVTEADHVRGPVDAPVTLVEYADFQCAHCGAAYRNLREVLRQRAELVRLVYRHFPITNVHPYAEAAAQIAEAAGRRGRFWDMHDWLYEHQDQLDPVHLSVGVEQLGLSADDVGTEVEGEVHADRVRQDFVGGIRSGVTGVPALFVDEVCHEGGYALADLLAAVDQAADT
ncbi:DsbA family protein [Micromonospora cathayae]|uniref:Thioredoxin domain-containing protein n=1 Tax=Micromonospora cathayae TaxID=3028804 RepID=A0ABY7ZRE8_9ACTN|nr:thioredoxin domain-containing protein [Micromonospora sp. HUAS 3]WDZ84638.1 thioredoxin domain-containing protein [Micromonospora sp. HUAS 3]